MLKKKKHSGTSWIEDEKSMEQPKYPHVENRLIKRLRIYLIVMMIISAAAVIEVIRGRFELDFVLIGALIGLVLGIVVSRIYHLSWDAETNNVVGSIDLIGAVLYACYLVFIFTRSWFLGLYVQGARVFAIVLGITAATMLARVLATRHGINKLLQSLNLK